MRGKLDSVDALARAVRKDGGGAARPCRASLHCFDSVSVDLSHGGPAGANLDKGR